MVERRFSHIAHMTLILFDSRKGQLNNYEKDFSVKSLWQFG